MIEDVYPERSLFEETLNDGYAPSFGYSWGDGEDDPEFGIAVGWCDRTKKCKPFVSVCLYWRTLQIGWLF